MRRFWIGNTLIKYGHDQQCGLGISVLWITYSGLRIGYVVNITFIWWTVVIIIDEGDVNN